MKKEIVCGVLGVSVGLSILFSGCSNKYEVKRDIVPIQKTENQDLKGISKITDCPEYTKVYDMANYDTRDFAVNKDTVKTIKDGKELTLLACLDRDKKDFKKDMIRFELKETVYDLSFDFPKLTREVHSEK